MYKIFFKDRALFLTDRIEQDLTHDFSSIYKFGNEGELKKFILTFENQVSGKSAFVYYHDLEELFRRFRSCFRNLLAAGGLVWNSGRTHFLGLRRLERADLPKGKLTPNETFEEAAIREVTEECGLAPLSITRPLGPTFHVYRLGESIILKETCWFEMTYDGHNLPTPQKSENITEAAWIASEETQAFIQNTYPSVREVLNAAGIE